MPTFIYRTLDNQRVPSVTTINKIGQDPGGLIHWAWMLGMDQKDYRQVRDDAAAAGTVGHAIIEAAVRGTEPDLSTFSEETQASGRTAYEAYMQWRQQTNIEIIESEIPLVSEKHRFGGCIDAVSRTLDGKLSITDFKTGKVYPDHLCQIAAYRELWNENKPAQQITGGYHLCHFNRETGDFGHHYFSDLSDAWEAFHLKRQLYDKIAQLKKRV